MVELGEPAVVPPALLERPIVDERFATRAKSCGSPKVRGEDRGVGVEMVRGSRRYFIFSFDSSKVRGSGQGRVGVEIKDNKHLMPTYAFKTSDL